MTNKELVKTLKYTSPLEILVVTLENKIKLLKCPFKVMVTYSIGDLKPEQVVFVSEVRVTSQLVTVFIIHGDAYYYYHFEILI